ncbi:MAG: hypothetical protein ACO4AI_02465 [Prochlorothrix sp.]|nr:hypothetical protein [Prochlorothrix sp.]
MPAEKPLPKPVDRPGAATRLFEKYHCSPNPPSLARSGVSPVAG